MCPILPCPSCSWCQLQLPRQAAVGRVHLEQLCCMGPHLTSEQGLHQPALLQQYFFFKVCVSIYVFLPLSSPFCSSGRSFSCYTLLTCSPRHLRISGILIGKPADDLVPPWLIPQKERLAPTVDFLHLALLCAPLHTSKNLWFSVSESP